MMGLLCLMVFSLWGVAFIGIEALSISRAYISVASTWSGSQRDAAFHLTQYAASHDPGDYADFLQAMQRPAGARRALAELSAPDANPEVARAAFRETGIDPMEIDEIMRSAPVLRRLGLDQDLLARRETLDAELNKLRDLASLLHAQIVARSPSDTRLDYLLSQIHDTTHRVHEMETAFAHDVARASWQVKRVVLTTMTLAALAVLLLGALLARELFLRARRSESALIANEKRLRDVVGSVQEVIFQLDPEGRIVFLNDAWSRLTGFSVAESLGRSFLDFGLPDEAEQHRTAFQSALTEAADDVRFEARCRTRERGHLWVSTRCRAFIDDEGRAAGISGTFTDITARVSAQGELSTRARQQAAVAALGQKALAGSPLPELMNEAVLVLARHLNVEFTKVLELLPEGTELLLRAAAGWDQALVGKARVSAGRDSQAGYTMLSEGPVVVADLAEESRFTGPRLLTESGVKSGISVRILAQGCAFGVLGAHTLRTRSFSEDDVHFVEAIANVLSIAIERVRAEEVLRASESRYRELMEHASDGIFICDLDGRLVQVNRRACEMTGYDAEEMLTLSIYDLLPAGEMAESPPDLERVHEDRIALAETRIERKNGSAFPVEISAKRIRGEMIQALVRDISRRKEAEATLREREEQLQQSQKMEALGRLAGGIAHDFNNLLTAILGYAGTGLAETMNGDPLRRNLEEIKHAGETAAVLTRQLLAFSRKQVLTPVVFDLNDVVERTRSVLQRILGEQIDIVTDLEPGPLPIRADRVQFEQVLLNLAVNARDAMPQGGRLSLATRSEGLRDHGRPERVILSVADTGTGMDEGTQARVFEPFFTTKGLGQGTGLGLSTVYGIIQQSRGCITVESEPGGGSLFTIVLPAANGPIEVSDPQRRSPAESAGSETVLLVEDEEVVRNLAAEVLRREGYHVKAAADGHQALRILHEPDGPIHLLATDIVMPGMSGRQLAHQVRSSHPSVRVLFISGYTEDALGEDGIIDEGMFFLQKPFEPSELTRLVRTALDAAPGAPVSAD